MNIRSLIFQLYLSAFIGFQINQAHSAPKITHLKTPQERAEQLRNHALTLRTIEPNQNNQYLARLSPEAQLTIIDASTIISTGDMSPPPAESLVDRESVTNALEEIKAEQGATENSYNKDWLGISAETLQLALDRVEAFTH